MYSAFIGKVKHKEIQNFKNKTDSGSIMYFEFIKDFAMKSVLEGLLWGGKKINQRTSRRIFCKE